MLARTLNRTLGTTTITPWGLAQLPDVYIEFIIEGLNLQAELAEAGLLGK